MQNYAALYLVIEILIMIVAAVTVVLVNRRNRRCTWSTRGRNTNVDINP